MAARDRDPSGRARNARARDGLGRPLPRGAEGVPPVPDDLDLAGDETVATAQDLLDRGLPFQAHEVLEARWKRCPEPERDLWQGLAQLAVGVTHLRRGNRGGGGRLLRRGSIRLGPYTGTHPYGIAVDGILGTVAAALDAIGTGRDPDLTIHLKAPR